MPDLNEQDLLDLIEWAEGHLRDVKGMLDVSLDGDTIDHIVASATYAKRRIDQLIEQVLEAYAN